MKGFRKRNTSKIFIGRPSPQEAERWAAIHATDLTTNIASIEHVIETNNIPPSHIANIDETGVTPNRDTREELTGKVVMRRRRRAMGSESNAIGTFQEYGPSDNDVCCVCR